MRDLVHYELSGQPTQVLRQLVLKSACTHAPVLPAQYPLPYFSSNMLVQATRGGTFEDAGVCGRYLLHLLWNTISRSLNSLLDPTQHHSEMIPISNLAPFSDQCHSGILRTSSL